MDKNHNLVSRIAEDRSLKRPVAAGCLYTGLASIWTTLSPSWHLHLQKNGTDFIKLC